MKTKLATKKVTAPKTGTITSHSIIVSSLSDSALAIAYNDIREEEKSLKLRKVEVQEEAVARMGDTKFLETSAGTFTHELRQTREWSIDSLKEFFGKSYTKYVKADSKKVKAAIALSDNGSELEALATVKETMAVTLR